MAASAAAASRRVLRPVDKADQVALIEVPEPVDLVADRDRAGQPVHDLRGVLKAQVHPVRPDMEEQVARRGHRTVPAAGQRAERMQLGRPRPGEQPVPGQRADPYDAGELAFRDPEPDRPLQPGQVAEQVANSGLAAVIHGHDEEDGRCRQRRKHRLGRAVGRAWHPAARQAVRRHGTVIAWRPPLSRMYRPRRSRPVFHSVLLRHARHHRAHAPGEMSCG